MSRDTSSLSYTIRRTLTVGTIAAGGVVAGLQKGCDSKPENPSSESRQLTHQLNMAKEKVSNEAASNVLIDATIDMLRYSDDDREPIGGALAGDKRQAILGELKKQDVRVQSLVHGTVIQAHEYLTGKFKPSPASEKDKLIAAVDAMVAAKPNVKNALEKTLGGLREEMGAAIWESHSDPEHSLRR